MQANNFKSLIDRQLHSIEAINRTPENCAFTAFLQDYRDSGATELFIFSKSTGRL